MIYLLILLLLVFLTWYYDVRGFDNQWRVYAFWGVFAVFFLLSGLRYKIGVDTLMYMRYWDRYGDIWDFDWIHDIQKFQGSSTHVERFRPGWILLSMLVKGFTNDFTALQLVISLLFNTALFLAIKKYSKKPFLTLLMFYISFKFIEFEFEIMRETFSVAIFMLFGFPGYMKKRWLQYYIVAVICFLLHTSSVVMFALPLLRNLEWSKMKYSLLVVLPGLVIGLAGRIIFGDLINVFLGGDDFISSYTADAFSKENNTNYLIMYSVQPVLLYVMTMVGYRHIKNKAFIPLIFFAISFMFMGMLYFTASRLVNYIIIYVFIAVTPIMADIVKRSHTVWVCVLCMLLYFAPTLYSFSKPTNVARYYPYQWVINPQQTQLQKTL